MADGLFPRLERALAGGWDRWMLSMDREDPRSFLQDMVRSLKGSPSDGYFGKRIDNKHRYIGLGPTIAWMLTSKDPSYPVAYESMVAFGRLWDVCAPALGEERYHYVSLGVGTGDKDRHILDRLQQHGSDETFYVAVDISSAMLNIGTEETRYRMSGRVLLMELDFEEEDTLAALRGFLSEFVGDEPILYGLLGNSLGNIEDDRGFLRNLSILLRPQDRLVLEVATTTRLDVAATRIVEAERGGSRLYNEFVTAALAMYTNLTINTNWLKYEATIGEGYAIRVEGSYVNRSGSEIALMLPNRDVIPYRIDEGIQVLLGRRYSLTGVRRLLDEADLVDIVAESGLPAADRSAADRRGIANTLLLLRREESRFPPPSTPLARVWGMGALNRPLQG